MKVGDTFNACLTPDVGYSATAYTVNGVEHDIEDGEKGQPCYVNDIVQSEGGSKIGGVFEANTYEVTLLDKEKSNTFESVTVTYGQPITLPTTHEDTIGYTVQWHDGNHKAWKSGEYN